METVVSVAPARLRDDRDELPEGGRLPVKIQTARGEFDTSQLIERKGREDSDRYFGPFVEYSFLDGTVCARFEGRDYEKGAFLKVNRFAAPVEGPIQVLIDGEMTTRLESELDKRCGQLDNENEFSMWVEYRLPGTDTIVRREPHVILKRQPEAAAGAAGSF